MIVQSNQSPNFNDLIQTLKEQFPNYTVYKFDSKPLKSIIVQKTAIIGAQLTLRENKIMVDACCPNIFVSSLLGVLSAIFPPYINFEMKIADFLKNKYN